MDHGRSGEVRIGELAAELGLNPKTIRYYEEAGLLPAPRRDASGYRRFERAHRERLRFIVKAKRVGLTLREIGEILALRDGGTEPCPHVRDLVDRKLAAVEEHLRRLADHRTDMLALRAAAASTPCSSTSICAAIELHTPPPRR